MTRPMYQVPKTRKNASKKVTDNTISKRKKLVLNFVQREEIIQKSKNGYCAKKLALDFKVGLSTVYDIIAKGPAELSKFRKENPGSTIRCTFKTSHYPLTDQALKLWFIDHPASRPRNNCLSQKAIQGRSVENVFSVLSCKSPRHSSTTDVLQQVHNQGCHLSPSVCLKINAYNDIATSLAQIEY